MPGLVRRLSQPPIGALSRVGPIALTPDEWLDDPEALAFQEDAKAFLAELDLRYPRLSKQYPREYAVEGATAVSLYCLIRKRHPQTVLETGVANGHTTAVILAALNKNGSGTLISTDVADEVGGLLSAAEREEWRYFKMSGRRPRSAFKSLLRQIGPVDLFFHDSDHTYEWQTWEYETVFGHMSPQGILASDDVDGSYAFIDFVDARSLRPRLLFDRREIAGLIDLAQQG